MPIPEKPAAWNQHGTAWLAPYPWDSFELSVWLHLRFVDPGGVEHGYPHNDCAYSRRALPVPKCVLVVSQEHDIGRAAVLLADLIGIMNAPRPRSRREPDNRYWPEGLLARHLVTAGNVWTESTQPIGPAPNGLPALVQHDWRHGGCGHYAAKYIAKDDSLEHWVGWLLFPGTDGPGPLWGWAHEWCVAPGGILIDPTLGTCGVAPGFAYIGARLDAEEKLISDIEAQWAKHALRRPAVRNGVAAFLPTSDGLPTGRQISPPGHASSRPPQPARSPPWPPEAPGPSGLGAP